MFKRLKTVFGAVTHAPEDVAPDNDIWRWALEQGFDYTQPAASRGEAFTLTRKSGALASKLELGPSSRDFIRGLELRGRAELGPFGDVSVVVMNRALKDALEKIAYAQYTDTLQTVVDQVMTEELRWLAMYPEFGWDGPDADFWERYAVMADTREHAVKWLTPELADLLLDWPPPSPSAQVPLMLMLLRGKCFLRMEYSPAGLSTLAHASSLLACASASALDNLSTDIVL